MKYIWAFLILMSGLAGIVGLTFSVLYIGDKIKGLEFNLDRKYEKYRHFKENIGPWIFMVVFSCILIASLVAIYLQIVEWI